VNELECFTEPSVTLAPTAHGSLDGVRIAVKDLIDIAGHQSSFGHARWRDTHEPSAVDAPIVAQLRAAGGTVVGTTKMDQLAYSLIGNVGEGSPPINSFDEDSYCGGSSSGSASAVTGDAADLGVGTDTAGSIRVPAAACGLFSIRPTHGRVDTTGVVPLAPSFDVIGFFAREPGLLQQAIDVVAPATGATAAASTVLCPMDVWASQDTKNRSSMQAAAEQIGSAFGASVVEADMSRFMDESSGDLLARLQGREIWAEHSRWVTDNIRALADDVQQRLRRCETLADDPLEEQGRDRQQHIDYKNELFSLIPAGAIAVVPVRPRVGPLRAWTDDELLSFRVDSFRLGAPSTLAGLPQVVIPTQHDSQYVPLGLIGAPNSEEMLLRAAAALSTNRSEP